MRKLNAGDGLDPLGDALSAVRFRSTLFCRSEFSAPWGFAVEGRDIATFHFVESGGCWLEVDGMPTQTPLAPGDFVILSHGHRHVVRDAPQSQVTRLDDLLKDHPEAQGGTLRTGGGGAASSLICGGFFFEDRNALPFMSAVPPVLLVREQSSRIGSWLRVAQEAIAVGGAERACENTILSRIADLVFIEAIRSHFTDEAVTSRYSCRYSCE